MNTRPRLSGSFASLGVRHNLMVTMNEIIHLHIPSEDLPEDHDNFTSHGPDISQPKAEVTWSVTVIRGRKTHIRVNNEVSGAYKGLVYVPKPGDIVVSAPVEQFDLLKHAFTTRGSYVQIEDERYAIQDVGMNQVEESSTAVFACRRA